MKSLRNVDYKQIFVRHLVDVVGVKEEDIDYRNSINNSHQFDSFLEKYGFKKEMVNIAAVVIHYNSNLNKFYVSKEVSDIATSRIVDVKHFESVKITHKNRIVNVDKFTSAHMSVKLTEAARKEIADKIFGGTLLVNHNPHNGDIEIYLETQEAGKTLYHDLAKDKKSTSDQITKNGYTKRLYRLNPVTGSAARNGLGVFSDVTLGDNRFKLFDDATCGALTEQYKTTKEKLKKVTDEESLKKVEIGIKKDYGYLGNVFTASYPLKDVEGFHVYEGPWLNTSPETFLTDEFIQTLEELNKVSMEHTQTEGEEIKRLAKIEELSEKLEKLMDEGAQNENAPTQDGQMYVNAIELAAMIYLDMKYFIDPAVLIGRMIQCRPATVKSSAMVVDPFTFAMFVKGSKDLAKSLGTKVSSYGNKDRALFIADKNCIKLEFDYNRKFDFEILAFNKTSEGHASKQMYKNMMYAAHQQDKLDRALELIGELEKLTIQEKLKNMIDGDKESKLVAPEEILSAMNTGFFTNLYTAVDPSFIAQSKPLYESAFRQGINAMVNACDRMHGALIIESRRLASDPTFILTGGKLKGILELGETFINDPRIVWSVMFKYPVAGLEEQYKSKNVLLKEIIKRVKKSVKACVITEDEGEAIIRFFGGLKRTIRVLPALMFLANACAGLDYDFDGECSIIKVKEPKTRAEEISNELCDILLASKTRGVFIKTN